MTYGNVRDNLLPVKRSIARSLLAAAFGAAAAGPVAAAVDLSAGASVGASYDTNALQISSIEPPPFAASGNDHRDDITMVVGVNAAAAMGGEGPTRLQLRATYSHVESKRFNTLGHDDYSFGGDLDWRPSQAFDASLQASQNRLPLGLADVGGESATLQRTRSVQGAVRVRPTPRWQLGLAPGWTESRTPLQDADGFRFREKTGTASLEFLRSGRLVPGVLFTEARGRYSGIEDATRYRQRTVHGTLNYRVTDFSTFALTAGHTRRTTHLVEPSDDPLALAHEGSDSAFTGTLSVFRQLSVKTSITASAFRYFTQYDAGVNTTVGNGFHLGLNWLPTAKIAVSLDSSYNYQTIDDLPIAGSTGKRDDALRSFSLAVSYAATRRVTLRTHVTRNIRRSEVWTAQFNSTVAGVQLAASID